VKRKDIQEGRGKSLWEERKFHQRIHKRGTEKKFPGGREIFPCQIRDNSPLSKTKRLPEGVWVGVFLEGENL